MKETTKTKLKTVFTPFFFVCLGVLLLGLLIKLIAANNAAFADFWQSKIASVSRAFFAYLTNLLPFSLAEFLILTSPLTIAVLIRIAAKKTDTWAKTLGYSLNLIAAASLVFSMFLLNFSAGYNTTALDERMGLERKNVSAEELYDTAKCLLDGLSDASEDMEFTKGENTYMPYSLSQLNKKLNEAYKKACEKYTFISNFTSNPKQVMLSEPWTYTHIAGVYTFFTGEANINVNFPDYTLPYTAAHEMAHQRGISREDEANFVAFVVCIGSDDDYIRYSAYANAYEYVASALYSADKDLYKQLYAEVPALLKNEMSSYNAFFEKYRENKAATLSNKVNDTFLKAQGQKSGSKSYGLVVDLLAAYYRK